MKKLYLLVLFLVGCTLSSVYGQIASQKVLITTSLGSVEILLYEDTPLHKNNFIKLVREGFYKDLLFHRIIPEFMIQGGDPDSKNSTPKQRLGDGDLNYTVKSEISAEHIHKRGALAAARMPDDINPEKASSACQFYLVQGRLYSESDLSEVEKRNEIQYSEKQKEIYKTIGGVPRLDGKYTVFGEVISGFETIDKIAALDRDKNDRPLQNVAMDIILLE